MSNVTFSIPPFPSQDLAKLVLGYLAEEQLMTAYDEFLQASPYLDAFQNEYDRIFMTSLKNILAEYRAVKIYVETCKPFALRRKLFQCSNLLEIVKFLVNNIDVNKLHSLDASLEKVGFSRHSLSKSYSCDVCQSLKLSNCTCKSSQSTRHVEANSFEGSVETTSLADLPGNISYNKKIVKDAEPKYNTSTSITSSDQLIDGGSAPICQDLSSSTFGGDTTDNVISSVNEKNCAPNPTSVVKEHLTESEQNVQGANDVINLISNTRNDSSCKQQNHRDDETSPHIEGTDTLQNVIVGDSSNSKVIVPDSSTSENIITQTSTPEVDNVTNSTNVIKSIRPPPHLIKIGSDHKHMSLQSNTLHTLPRLAAKPPPVKVANTKVEEQVSPKITILSDVKVDNDVIVPQILKSNPSKSLVPMQTLYINGTQAYKNQKGDQRFTKDEIMAMPTIIIVPASDKHKKIVPTVTQNNVFNAAVSCSTAQSFEPLVIDVSSNDDMDTSIQMNNANGPEKNPDKQANDNMLIKTVDFMSGSHASLPKDNTLAGVKTSTPQVLPPVRKSSSTPRRTSHVRVLDFTTPRRILNEVLNEQEGNHCPPDNAPLLQDASLPVINKNSEGSVNIVNNKSNPDKSNDANSGVAKEKKTNIRIYNWDSDLRALAYVGNGNIEKKETRRKTKAKKLKTKESPKNNSTSTPVNKKPNKSEDAKANKSNDIKRVTPKIKSTKCKRKSIEADKNDNENQVLVTSIVKPTMNIISRKKWTEPVETDKSQNKLSNVDAIDSPDLEKICLEKEIGLKLNISDLLETPYKQALYDIQMETPKFLGPDIPGDPLSDIKIMSIPTPRFLNTPKLPQNTPSSYSSRPTDYSSGGSYYKPDDQDYVLGNEMIADNLPLSVTSSKLNKESKSTDVQNGNIEKGCEGKSRPVRQCTKNVSYNYNKLKDAEEKIEKSSTCSESSINKSDRKIDKSKITKSGKDSLIGKQRETKKKSKKYKSPMKKEVPKTFMKIKPRRTTPVKEVLGKGRKKTSELSHVVYTKLQPKKVVADEGNVSFTPVAAPVCTKSRRKSSTPRKLHYTKRFNCKGAGNNSPESKKQNVVPSQITNINAISIQDSDNEQQALRWSDDGSQESKVKTTEERVQIANESDDISKIKEYISKTVPNEMPSSNECEGTLQVDLIKRGFDVETARRIERDLLETPTNTLVQQDIPVQTILQSIPSPISHEKEDESQIKKADQSIESDCSTSNNLQIVQDEDDNDEVDFSVQECNEDTSNYFVYNYDEANFTPSDQVKLKDTFSMEICIENDVAIRLRAMPFNTGFEHDSKHEEPNTCDRSSRDIPASSTHDALYTPRKAQCYQLFDSTLASLDTPLKSNSPNEKEFEEVAEIVLEVEADINVVSDIKSKPETKKRKRIHSGASDESLNGSKKVKPDTSYLLNSAGIKNIDIESVLSKLHGP